MVQDKFKPFHCNSWDNRFGKEIRLRLHIKTIHENIIPYNYESCGTHFSYKDHLTRHIKKVHENIKFFCDSCETFTTQITFIFVRSASIMHAIQMPFQITFLVQKFCHKFYIDKVTLLCTYRFWGKV